ncbi:23S rRNA (adenine(2030)-N(6))-methyltransferase RlmJ [Maliponia aquimaris]|uniref:Ribosomal RNA large subunit methyltransferase J n=1 Tax=Maliponia aquimaris TaxID=1673631 RepID=A0A238KKP9_9RHOB|nr:23S rRNA (adenine(2030)-N(6))-methyltransferase RlmJ [Maliponia aquimaris]SMX43300.1 Ribosomal RNA large subunit methyltransferase J [Maliponia aquimaris]
MLSYQHAYHAGNLADVHKHAALAVALDYLTRKRKPLSYIETHAGRGLYDLTGAEAQKTGEAAQGIARAEAWFGPDHPYTRALHGVRAAHGPQAYPGSPLIAQSLLRDTDRLHLAELHPQEHAALRDALRAPNVSIHRQDGFALAHSLCPPEPRRGLLLVDPSWEIKSDYATLPKWLAGIGRKWNVGVLMLWYPLLTDAPHAPMLTALQAAFPEGLRHEVRFPPARDGHRMIGSGLFVVNPPWGLADSLADLSSRFAALPARGS